MASRIAMHPIRGNATRAGDLRLTIFAPHGGRMTTGPDQVLTLDRAREICSATWMVGQPCSSAVEIRTT